MHAMQIEFSEQLVADRRVERESVAARRRLRRLISHRPAYDALSATPLAHRALVTIVGRRADRTETARGCRVA
jgi:hypothetical protein